VMTSVKYDVSRACYCLLEGGYCTCIWHLASASRKRVGVEGFAMSGPRYLASRFRVRTPKVWLGGGE
jgi:hypothetical protein